MAAQLATRVTAGGVRLGGQGRAAPPRRLVQAAAQKKNSAPAGRGFVVEDNSGKANIFPSQSKAFYSSPTTAAAASEGLGGAQGGVVLAGLIGLVGVATVAVLGVGSGETLSQVQGADLEPLATIASRIAASL